LTGRRHARPVNINNTTGAGLLALVGHMCDTIFASRSAIKDPRQQVSVLAFQVAPRSARPLVQQRAKLECEGGPHTMTNVPRGYGGEKADAAHPITLSTLAFFNATPALRTIQTAPLHLHWEESHCIFITTTTRPGGKKGRREGQRRHGSRRAGSRRIESMHGEINANAARPSHVE
jgi:hypothetical protein